MHALEVGRAATVRWPSGGHANPNLDPKIEPLELGDGEIDTVVAMMETLDGEGYLDAPPAAFPE